MAKRIKQLAIELGVKNSKSKKPIPLLFALEGGYNVHATSQAAVSVMTAILDQPQFPEMNNFETPIYFKDLKNHCYVPKEIHQQVDEIVKFHEKTWKSLTSDSLVKYTKIIKSNMNRVFGKVKSP